MLGWCRGWDSSPRLLGTYFLGDCSPDHESGAIARLGYPGIVFFSILKDNTELRFSGIVACFFDRKASKSAIVCLFLRVCFIHEFFDCYLFQSSAVFLSLVVNDCCTL
jgi:hypothetical protein